MSENEFYIGWKPELPPRSAKLVQRFILTLLIAIPALAIALVYYQRGFASSTFDLAHPITLEGTIYLRPAPFLVHAATGQQLLLVAPGKFGGKKSIESIEKKIGTSLDGKKVQAKGILIYHDGKTILELQEAKLLSDQQESSAKPTPVNLGKVLLRGEITDPKCLLGSMRPAEGKPHLDCAVRCIAGGITPVLKVSNQFGDTEYYILSAANGQSIQEALLPCVGQGVQICGTLYQHGDWLMLETTPGDIKKINKLSLNQATMCH